MDSTRFLSTDKLELLNFVMDPVLNISRVVRFNKDFSAVEKMLR